MLLNYHIGRIVLGSLCVGVLVRLGLNTIRIAGWKLQPATRIPLKANRTKSPTRIEPRTKRPMW